MDTPTYSKGPPYYEVYTQLYIQYRNLDRDEVTQDALEENFLSLLWVETLSSILYSLTLLNEN
jgi:hypothetical protein